ncbi:MAG: cyclic nucleotide-binding domain-containing protein [Burkholderiales bacterium]|nr:cyclic nucleotide-binding domain-containing protein [Burkholderiales bacterium]
MNMLASGLPLERVGVLAELDPFALQEVAAVMQPVKLAGGAMLCDQGDAGDTLYIVVHGRLRVSVAGARGGRRIVAELGRGESVGEMALLTGERRSARVEAIRDSMLLALSRSAFERVVEQYPRVMAQLARQLVERLKLSLRGAPVTHFLSTVCVQPAVPSARIGEFCERLARSLGMIGPTLHLTRSTAGGALADGGNGIGRGDGGDTRMLAWLNQQEERYAYVLYEADEADPVWSRLCERQADCIVLVARADDDTPPSPATAAPSAPAAGSARHELVLLNAGTPVAGAMERWLAALPSVQAWHHIADNHDGQVARFARLLVGQGIGMLLGGGGARTFAHIGVLRAMHEAGIEVDAIGGVSGGAIVGAQAAAGVSPQEMKERARDEFLRRGSLMDFTVPIVSLIRGRRFARMLTGLFAESTIEDLPMRFFCVSANLSRATMRVHDRGTIWRAVGASISIPGIGPPTCENGDLLIDGSVLTNLPVATMRELCQGRVVAVDVSADKDLSVDRSWTDFPSPARLLATRPWRRRAMRIPNILEILFRGAMLSSIAGERDIAQRVEFYLRPPLRGINLLDFKNLDQVEIRAYEYAVQALERWPFRTGGGTC